MMMVVEGVVVEVATMAGFHGFGGALLLSFQMGGHGVEKQLMEHLHNKLEQLLYF